MRSGFYDTLLKINNIYDMENTDSIQYIQHIIECVNDFYYVSIDTVDIKSDFISGKYDINYMSKFN